MNVPYARWLATFRELAQLVTEPPWELRKKFKQPNGSLARFVWLVSLTEKLERHQACATKLLLDAHG